MEDLFKDKQGPEQDNPEPEQDEPKFTQADLDAMFNKGFAKGKKGMPSDEELTEFRAWKDSQKKPEDKAADRQAEIDAALAEAEMARRENFLLRQGVDPEDVDYYVYKIGKTMDGETEFDDAAKEFLKTHKPKTGVRVDLTGRLNNGRRTPQSENETMNALLRGATK